jgi:hypothetical protein
MVTPASTAGVTIAVGGGPPYTGAVVVSFAQLKGCPLAANTMSAARAMRFGKGGAAPSTSAPQNGQV